MQCPTFDKLIDFQLDVIDGPEADAIADHLFDDNCPHCWEQIRKHADLAAALQADREERQKTRVRE